MEFPPITAWFAGVDYIRATSATTDIYPFWLKLARSAAVTDGDLSVERELRVMQYHGQSFGQSFAGYGEQGAMIQASGLPAHNLANSRLSFTFDNLPRLDLQLTVWFADDFLGLAQRLNTVAVVSRQAAGRHWPIRLINSNGSGDTLYVGARGGGAASHIRIYDKWRESSDDKYRHAWRFEVELTNRKAEPAYRVLRADGFSQHGIVAVLSDHLQRRGLALPPLGMAPMPIDAVPRPITTDESRIRWLATQVRPALDKLQSSGYDQLYLAKLLFGE